MQSDNRIKVLLVDDHRVVLDGLKAVLTNEDMVEVIGTASNGKEALQKADELSPDVVLMDISMPEMGGLEAMQHFNQQQPEIRVLMLSMHDDQEYIAKSMKAGASGYALKDVSSDELVKSIETIARGGSYFCSNASKSLFSGFSAQSEKEVSPLTQREQATLRLLADGKSNKLIASELNISVRTVEAHRMNIKKKLGINTAAGLTRYAIEHEL